MDTMHENIKTLRKLKGWSQIELSQMLGTTQKVISSYEAGTKKPPINRLPALAKVFNVTIEQIIGSDPLLINEKTSHIHKNSRVSIMNQLFKKLSADEQRVILKQVKTLVKS